MRRDLDALAAQVFDIVVVGGGIHGAWIAWRAAREGYRVALIEKHDFGGATSANSLKILHGDASELQMKRAGANGVEVLVTLPLRKV